MGRIEIAQEAERICSQYLFEKPRKRGRPKNRSVAGRPPVVDTSVVLKLEQAFSWGCSVNEAIEYGGIGKTAYYAWIALNPHFKERIEQLQQRPIMMAKMSVYEAMKHDGNLALKYLERRLPEEFSLKATIQHSFEFTGISLERPKQIAAEDITPEIEIERLD
jgi:hypothetical protein